jgi:hypothetical protein
MGRFVFAGCLIKSRCWNGGRTAQCLECRSLNQSLAHFTESARAEKDQHGGRRAARVQPRGVFAVTVLTLSPVYDQIGNCLQAQCRVLFSYGVVLDGLITSRAEAWHGMPLAWHDAAGT